jgi:hypothetical protein
MAAEITTGGLFAGEQRSVRRFEDPRTAEEQRCRGAEEKTTTSG